MSHETQLAQSNFSVSVHHYDERLMENRTCMHAQLLSRVRRPHKPESPDGSQSIWQRYLKARSLEYTAPPYSARARSLLPLHHRCLLVSQLHWLFSPAGAAVAAAALVSLGAPVSLLLLFCLYLA